MGEELRKLLGHQLRTGYEIQSGEGTNAPAVIFADTDYEVGDGSTGLHETQKPANEPAIVYLRADAAIAAMPAGVKVKPLEWQPWYYGEGFAQTILGTYNVTKTGWIGPRKRKEVAADNPKAAAQADYEQRILSAINLEVSYDPKRT